MEQKRSGAIIKKLKEVRRDLQRRSTLFKNFYKDRASDLSSALWETLVIPVLELKASISSVLYYLPVIWKSRNWDHGYCLDLYVHSLKRLRKGLATSKIRDNSLEVRQIDLIIKLLKSYNNDDMTKSTENLVKNLLQKYGLHEDDLNFDFETAKESKPGLFAVKFKYESILTKEDCDSFKQEYVRLIHDDSIKKRMYFKKALILIYQKSGKFWD